MGLTHIVRDRIVFTAFMALVALYGAVALADFLAPYSEQWADRALANAPPTPIYTIDDETGALTWPYVYRYEKTFDPASLSFEVAPDTSVKYPLKLFAQGEPYKLFSLVDTNVHLLGVDEPARLRLLGSDINGRDLFSRLLFGGQISLTIGFLGLFVAFPIGMIYGGVSGYLGGWIDTLMMRFTEILMSIPSLYLLISLAAILPARVSSTERYMLVVLILAFIGWAPLSRVIRGMVMAIKNEEFIEAERAIGLGIPGIILRHLLPQTTSYMIIAMTLGVPGYILAESGLSFLGLGIQQPDASWGNMLKEAQDITNLTEAPWMLMPGALIFLAVLAFNVIGDAIRDVLDPKQALRR
jgi:peptide/nickel transport system permease protein